VAEGEADAKLTMVNAEAQCLKVGAEQQSVVSQKSAESLKVEGQAEADLKGVLGLRRLYSYLNTKLEVVREMAYN
jgi:hypothetical protein